MPLTRDFAPPPGSLIEICPDTLQLLFPPGACTCNEPRRLYPDRMVIELRRKGDRDWWLQYPVHDADEHGWIDVRLDKNMQEACPGRYEGRFVMDGCPCGEFLLELRSRTCGVSTEGVIVSNGRDFAPPMNYPEGVTDMFDEIVTFVAHLSSRWTRGDKVMPLCDEDKDKLCGMNLCKPVELHISDGVNEELVKFSGCVGPNKVMLVDRGVGGTKPQIFPKGAQVRFVWSTTNVINAKEGC